MDFPFPQDACGEQAILFSVNHIVNVNLNSPSCSSFYIINLYSISTDQSLTSDLKKLKAELKKSYRLEFSEIKTSPLDPQSLRKLEQIYVHLVLLGEEKDKKPISVDYDELFKIFANEKGKTRIAFLGEAGAGKTTLLTKIAYDWAVGERLQDISLLFLVRLREVGKCTDLAKIPQNCVSDGIDLLIGNLDEYMNDNQRRIMFLLDGLDEYKGDIKVENANDALIDIMRGDKMKRAPVIVTTRPWRAEQITSIDKINQQYKRIRVEGFKKHDVQVYIIKFFERDMESAQGLINLVTEESLIAKTMAPYPIFCCMLCHMWKSIKKSDRKKVRKLKTFSEFIQEMIKALVEQYASKIKDSGESSEDCQMRCKKSFERIGEVAFRGLLVKQLAFDEEAFKDCMNDVKTGCEIGVLSSKKKFAPSEIRQIDSSEQLSEVSFPHKLLQEYLAGIYFASLYRSNKPEFDKLLRDNILQNPGEFKYLLYFTAAHGKEPGQAGRPLIETLCDTMNIELDNMGINESLIVDVAFECHAEIAVSPVVDHLSQKTNLRLSGPASYINYTDHTLLGYLYVLAACGRKMVRIYSI